MRSPLPSTPKDREALILSSYRIGLVHGLRRAQVAIEAQVEQAIKEVSQAQAEARGEEARQ